MLLAALLLQITVALPADSRVRGVELSVGAVATVSGGDAALVERVRAVSLGYAPAPGYSRLLQDWRLRQELATSLPGVQVVVTGATSTRVWPQTEVVSAGTLEAEARRELERHLAGRDGKVRLLRPLQALEVPAPLEGLVVQSVLAAGELGAGTTNVPVRVQIDGVVHRTVWTSWEVSLYEERPVLVRGVRAGEVLTADAVELRRVALGSEDGALSLQMAIGATSTRDLAAGSTLSGRDLVRPPLVQRGSVVYLEVRKGSVQARVAAVAGKAGARGDRIPVTTLAGGRELEATILSRDLVTIDLTPR